MRILVAMTLLVALISPSLCADEGKEAAFVRLGTEALKVKNYQRALKSFGEAVRVNPASAEAQRGLGMAYLKLGCSDAAYDAEMLGEAAEAFREAVRLSPDHAESHYHLGSIYLALHNKDAALKEYGALKPLDAKLAEELQTAIRNYKRPVSYGSDQSGRGYHTPVAITGNQVLVPVTLTYGDRSAQATLVLDTGASITVITAELATRLGLDLRNAPRIRAQVVGGGVVSAWYVRIGVAAGPYSKEALEVAVISRAFAADGLLGMNFLRNYKYHIDFNNHVIDWVPPQ